MKLNDAVAVYAGADQVTGIFRGADQWWSSTPGVRKTMVIDDLNDFILPNNGASALLLGALLDHVGEGCYISSVNWIDLTVTYVTPGSITDPIINMGMVGMPFNAYDGNGESAFSVPDEDLEIDTLPFSLTVGDTTYTSFFFGLTTLDVDVENETLDYTIVNGFDTFPVTFSFRIIVADPSRYPIINPFDMYIFLTSGDPMSMFIGNDPNSGAVVTIDAVTINYDEVCGEPLPKPRGRSYYRQDFTGLTFSTPTEFDLADYWEPDLDTGCNITGYTNFRVPFTLLTSGDSTPAMKVEFLGDSFVSGLDLYNSYEVENNGYSYVISGDKKTVICGASGTIESPTISGVLGYDSIMFRTFTSGALASDQMKVRLTPLASDPMGELPSFSVTNMYFDEIIDCPVKEEVLASNIIVSSASAIDLLPLIDTEFYSVHLIALEVDFKCNENGSENSALAFSVGGEYGPYSGPKWFLNEPATPVVDYAIGGESDGGASDGFLAVGCTDFPPTDPSQVTGFTVADGLQTAIYQTSIFENTNINNDTQMSIFTFDAGQIVSQEETTDLLEDATGLGGTTTIDLWTFIEDDVVQPSVTIEEIELTVECLTDGAGIPWVRIDTDFYIGYDSTVTGGATTNNRWNDNTFYLGSSYDGFEVADGLATVTLECNHTVSTTGTELSLTALDDGSLNDSNYRIVNFTVRYKQNVPHSGQEYEITEIRLRYQDNLS